VVFPLQSGEEQGQKKVQEIEGGMGEEGEQKIEAEVGALASCFCDRTVKLNGLIKRNGHHLNTSGTLA
jgi:hypothetical protein